MRTPHWLVSLLLVLGVGVGLGYSMVPVRESARPAVETHEQPDAEMSRMTAPLPASADPAEPSVPATPVAPDHDPLIEALKQWGLADLEPMPGSITARAVNADGMPLAGVRIELYPILPWGRSSGRADIWAPEDEFWRSLAENNLGTAKTMVQLRRHSQALETDARGEAVFSGLVDVPYRMGAALPGHALTAQGPTEALKPGDSVTWGVRPHGGLRVTVEAPADAGPLRVFARYADYAEPTTLELLPGEIAELRLRPGDWTVRAHARDGRHTCEAVKVTVPDDGELAPLTLRLNAVARVRVRVKFTGGVPQWNECVLLAPVRAELADAEHFDERRRLATPLEQLYQQPHEYQAADLAPGPYLVQVALTQGQSEIRRVDAVAGTNTIEVEFSAPGETAGIVCEVEGPPDRGQPGALYFEALTAAKDGRASADHVRRVWKLSSGRYLLLGAEGATAIRATWHPLGTITREVGRSTLRFHFESPFELQVRLEGRPETLNRHVQAYLKWLDTGNAESGSFTRADKSEKFKGQPGRVELQVEHPEFYGMLLARKVLTLRAGETREVTLRLPEMFELVIEAPAEEVYELKLQPAGEDSREYRLQFGQDGRCILPHVPTGSYTLKYRLRSRPRDELQRSVTVQGNTTTRLR